MKSFTLFQNYLINLPDKPSANTVKNYLSDIGHFEKWYEQTYGTNFEPENVAPRDLENFRKFLQSTSYSFSTIERHTSSLRKYFQFLSIEGLAQNPFTQWLEKNNAKSVDFYRLKDFKNFLYTSGKESNTIKNYMADVSHFFGWLEKTHEDYNLSEQAKMAKINSESISEYKKRIVTILGLSSASVARKLSSLRQYCQWAFEKGYLEKNPFSQFQISNFKFQINNERSSELTNLDLPAARSQQPESDSGVAASDAAPQNDNYVNPIVYSRFPPLRLMQKMLGAFDTILLATTVRPLNRLLTRLERVPLPQVGTYIKVQRSRNEFYGTYRKPLLSIPIVVDPKIVLISAVLVLLAAVGGFLAYQRFSHPQDMLQEKAQRPKETSETEKALPKAFVFSGRLSTIEGSPVTQPSLVIFSFYDDPESFKNVLYQEVADVTPDDQGFFTRELAKVPQALLASSTPVYLGIALKGDAEMRPRQLIAGKEQGMAALFNAAGQLIIANDSPSFIAQSGSFTITGQKVLIRTKDQSNGSIVLWPDGEGKVDVLSAFTNSLTGVVAVADSLSVAASGGTTPFAIELGGASLFSVDAQGAIKAVGAEFAGTITPSKGGTYDLGTSVLTWKTIYANNVIAPSSGTQGYWQRNSGALSPSNITDDLLIGAIATSSAKFRVAGINGNITTSGDVAVNGGDITSSDTLTITPGGGKNLNISLSTTGDFSVNSGQLYVDTSSGNVGIGTSTPNALFAIGNNKVAVTASGNVGIGTTSPASSLQVVGRVILDASTGSSSSGLCWSGTITSAQIEDCSSAPTDLAENFGTLDPSIEAGDVVVVSGEATEVVINGRTTSKAFMKKSKRAYEETILGIVSTDPNEVYGDDGVFERQENPRPVSLAGRVPVKVSTENGPIAPGDYLTSSSIPGVAMKATRAGPTVGKALESFDGREQSAESLEQNTLSPTPYALGKILAFINLSFYDPDILLTSTGNLIIKEATYSGLLSKSSNHASYATMQLLVNSEEMAKWFHGYIVTDTIARVIDRIGVFSDAVIGNLRAGLIEATQIVTRTLDAKRIATSVLDVATDNVTIAGQTLKEYIAQIVNEVLDSQIRNLTLEVRNYDNIVAPIASNDVVRTNVISPLASDTINIQGNASVSGELAAQQVTADSLTTNTATISGTLRAKSIIAENIEALEQKLASVSAQQTSTVSYIGKPDPLLASKGEAFLDSATLRIEKFFANTGSFLDGLLVIGPSGLSDVSVSGMLTIGPQFILADKAINVLGADLALQPLAQGGVSMLGGKVYIDSMGNLAVDGNVTVKAVLTTNILSPIPDRDLVIRLGSKQENNSIHHSSFIIHNSSDSAVLRITDLGDLIASGGAQFANITTQKLTLPEIIEKIQAAGVSEKANGSVGIATIAAYTYEITIETPLVTQDSLIFVTPITNTKGLVPYIARQLAGESFTVAIGGILEEEMSFNWWIIN